MTAINHKIYLKSLFGLYCMFWAILDVTRTNALHLWQDLWPTWFWRILARRETFFSAPLNHYHSLRTVLKPRDIVKGGDAVEMAKWCAKAVQYMIFRNESDGLILRGDADVREAQWQRNEGRIAFLRLPFYCFFTGWGWNGEREFHLAAAPLCLFVENNNKTFIAWIGAVA